MAPKKRKTNNSDNLSALAQKYLDVAAVMMVSLNRQGKVTLINKEGQRVLGHKKKDIEGKDWFANFIPQEMRREIKKIFNQLMAGKVKLVTHYENPVLCKEGELKMISWHNSLLKDKQGKIIGVLSSGSDITKERQLRDDLAKSEELYRVMTESSPDCLKIFDKEGKIVYINKAGLKEHSLQNLQAAQKWSYEKSVVPASRVHLKKAFAQALKGKVSTFETEHAPGTSDRHSCLETLAPIKDANGKVTGVFGSSRDISERIQSEELLRDSELKYRTLVESANDAIFTIDRQGNVLSVNTTAARLLKRQPKVVVGKPLKKLFPPKIAEENLGNIKKVFKTGKGLTKESKMIVGEGKSIDISTSLSPILNPDKKVVAVLGITRDVSEQKQALEKIKQSEQKLRESEKRFQDVAMSSADWIWEVDREGKYVYASGRVKHVLGYAPQELIGKTPFDFMPKDEAAKIGAEFAEIAKKNKPIKDLENVNIKKNGEKIVLSTSGVPLKDKAGKLLGYRGVDKDITKKKEREAKILDSEERLQSIVNSVSDLIFVIDRGLRFQEYYVQPDQKDLLYELPRKFMGKTISEVFPSEFQKLALPPVKEAMKKGVCTKFDYAMPIKGQLKYFAARNCPRLDEKGDIVGVTVVSRDITERVLAQEDLEKFKLAVVGASDHIIITDPGGKILYANEAASKNTGYSIKELIGATPSLWGQQMPREYYRDMWHRISVEKKPFFGEAKNKMKNGIVYDAELHIFPILDENGEVKFFIGIERDITTQKEVDRAKTEFVSLASHQLRSPLTAVNWYSEMLLDESQDLDPKRRKYLQEINDGNRRMTRLVEALLNASRIELENFVVDPKLTDLTAITDDVLSDLSKKIAEKKLKVTEHYDPNLPEVKVDQELFSMIIENLLGNAVKYTKDGGSLNFNMSKEKSNLKIKVADTGCGIPKQQQPQIFHKLFRADNASIIDPTGHGLGLYIVKSIMDKVGGKIWFDSVEGKGTTFYVTIPLSGMKPFTKKKLK